MHPPPVMRGLDGSRRRWRVRIPLSSIVSHFNSDKRGNNEEE